MTTLQTLIQEHSELNLERLKILKRKTCVVKEIGILEYKLKELIEERDNIRYELQHNRWPDKPNGDKKWTITGKIFIKDKQIKRLNKEKK